MKSAIPALPNLCVLADASKTNIYCLILGLIKMIQNPKSSMILSCDFLTYSLLRKPENAMQQATDWLP